MYRIGTVRRYRPVRVRGRMQRLGLHLTLGFNEPSRQAPNGPGVIMFILKSCPKCHGDLVDELDEYSRTRFTSETDFACLQCGYRLRPAERNALMVRLLAREAALTRKAA